MDRASKEDLPIRKYSTTDTLNTYNKYTKNTFRRPLSSKFRKRYFVVDAESWNKTARTAEQILYKIAM